MAKIIAFDARPGREPKRPSAIDVHVGTRLRQRRIERGISQEVLARRLDISHHQLQKYEAGLNRVSAARLYQIAVQLEAPIGWFFEGLG